MNDESVSDILPLSPAVFHILLALADGERHGYVIAKDVEMATRGSLKIGPTTLYRIIRHLVTDEWIVEGERDQHDQRRRKYALTARGRVIVSAEAERLARAVGIARERRLITVSM
jgi:DNA-binding PadR family transcriptional regulator